MPGGVTVGDSSLCCCVPCLSSAITSLCLLAQLALILQSTALFSARRHILSSIFDTIFYFLARFHRSLKERLAAAEILADTQPPCPILVDNMADEANHHYGVVSERLYIVLNGRIVYNSPFGPRDYSIQAVEDWLSAYQQSLQHRVN